MTEKIDREKFKKKFDLIFNLSTNGGQVKNAATDIKKKLYEFVYLENDQVKMRALNAELHLMLKEISLPQVIQELKDKDLWDISE